jgi:uncharacterized membrane protein
MAGILWEWANFGLRWLHVITGIAWIGSSFYFVHLDSSLRKRDGLPEGAGGEAWQVHGGGFYNMVKYLVAPTRMPEDLTWFKWEAYSTWITGFFLLGVLYYANADLYMIDRHVLDLPVWAAITISLATLALGWIAYDRLCKSPVGRNDTRLALTGFAGLVAAAFLFTLLFSGRGAFIQIGALIGTMMAANVFLVIIPNQRKVVDALIRGETPDPKLGKEAKQRSMHNNYLTLPVLFLMISNHYPLAFASCWNWVIVALVLIVGATVRHFYNTRHAGKGDPWWTWGVAAVGMLAIIWLSSFPPTAGEDVAAAEPAATADFAAVEEIILSRCSMCHADLPAWEGVNVPPKGVMLHTPDLIRRHAHQIEMQAVRTHAMPPGNLTEMTPEERQTVAAWLAAGAPGE